MTSEKLKQALRESAAEEFLNIQSETILWEPSEQLSDEMETLFKQTGKKRRPVLKRGLLVAAVILLFSAMTISVFGVSDIRNKVIEYFSNIKSGHVEVEYGYNEAGDINVCDSINDVYTLINLPDGFTEVSHTDDIHTVVTIWENENGDSLILQQGDGITKRSIDTERLKKTYITISGTEFEAYSEAGFTLLMWNTEKHTFSIDYYGQIEPEVLAGIAADNLILKNSAD